MLPEVRAAMERRRAVRAPRRAHRRGGRPARDAQRSRVGAGHEWLFRRLDARHRGLRRRRKSRSPCPPPEPERLRQDEAIIPTHSRNVYDAAIAPSVSASSKCRRPTSSRRRSGHDRAHLHPGRARTSTRARSSSRRSPRSRKARACRWSSMRRRDPDDPQRPSASTARRSSPTAAASACADRRPPACCSAARISCAAWVHSAPHHGFTRSLKVGKEERSGCSRRSRCGSSATTTPSGSGGRLARSHRAACRPSPASPTVMCSPRACRTARRRCASMGQAEAGHRPARPSCRHAARRRAAHRAQGRRRAAQRGAETGVSVTPYMMPPATRRSSPTVCTPCCRSRRRSGNRRRATPAADLTGQWNVRDPVCGRDVHPDAAPDAARQRASAARIRATS